MLPGRRLSNPRRCPVWGAGLAAARGSGITLDEALRAFTLEGAYAEFAEKEKGSLQPGKLADFVLFERDFSRGPVGSLHEARVRMTVVGGRAYDF